MAGTTTAVRSHAGPDGGAAPVAGVPSGAGAPAGVVLRTQPHSGRFGPLRLGQLVLIEVAVAVPLAAWATHPLLLVPACVVAVALVLLAVVRRHRRPAPEWLAAAVALRARRRGAGQPVPPGTDPGLAPAVECEPALRTLTYLRPARGGPDGHADREQRAVGMVGDGTFLTAVLQVQACDVPLRPLRTARPLPLDLVYGALEVDGVRLESVQVVQHTQPAPAPHLPEQAMAARSYAPLQARSGAPAVRLTWIALKLDPQLCPEAVRARGGGLVGAQRALLRAADQLASRLAGAGFDARVLDEAGLTSAIATSACVNPHAGAQASRTDTPARRTAETSRTWRCDDRRHTTYWIGRWPRLGPGATPAPNLVALLTSMPALASTFSLTASRGPGDVPALTGHIRVTGRSDTELVATRRQLERAARGVKVDLVRLDREQVPGVLATLPLGGAR
ncbi:type VII secretion protein EccE [Streptomyces sp. ICBB 8177]|uniref:type VII secretion protein EccE n=1 Tax=Streptomyces sp. ICBB 8177 TaxID=563922 RepID=UPI000D678869|nr:type VII secretion protein EccE [Streptomyces sp. ICBB 8177]PWI43614.1 type VII secretion protein EccE [Streptomyces sp. ICBB 8177]